MSSTHELASAPRSPTKCPLMLKRPRCLAVSPTPPSLAPFLSPSSLLPLPLPLPLPSSPSPSPFCSRSRSRALSPSLPPSRACHSLTHPLAHCCWWCALSLFASALCLLRMYGIRMQLSTHTLACIDKCMYPYMTWTDVHLNAFNLMPFLYLHDVWFRLYVSSRIYLWYGMYERFRM